MTFEDLLKASQEVEVTPESLADFELRWREEEEKFEKELRSQAPNEEWLNRSYNI